MLIFSEKKPKEDRLFDQYIKIATDIFTHRKSGPLSQTEITKRLRDLINQAMFFSKKFAEWYLRQFLFFIKQYNVYPNTEPNLIMPDFMDKLSELRDYLTVGRGTLPSLNTTFEEAFALSDAWHEKMRAKGSGNYKTNNVLFPLEDGYTLVSVPDSDLKTEGFLMDHCVGSYCNEVNQNRVIVLSIRDENNNPHITIGLEKIKQTNSWSIFQVKGKGNDIQPKYAKYVKEAIEKLFDKYSISFSNEGMDDYKSYFGEKYTSPELINIFDKLDSQPDVQHDADWYKAYQLTYMQPTQDQLYEFARDNVTEIKNEIDFYNADKYIDHVLSQETWRSDFEEYVKDNKDSLFFTDEDLEEQAAENDEDIESLKEDRDEDYKNFIESIRQNKFDIYLVQQNEDIVNNYFQDLWDNDIEVAEFALEYKPDIVNNLYKEDIIRSFDSMSDYDVEELDRYYRDQRYQQEKQRKKNKINEIMQKYNIVIDSRLSKDNLNKLLYRIYNWINIYTSDDILAREIKYEVEKFTNQALQQDIQEKEDEIKIQTWDQQLKNLIPGYNQLTEFSRTLPLYQWTYKDAIDQQLIQFMTVFVQRQLSNSNANNKNANWIYKYMIK